MWECKEKQHGKTVREVKENEVMRNEEIEQKRKGEQKERRAG